MSQYSEKEKDQFHIKTEKASISNYESEIRRYRFEQKKLVRDIQKIEHNPHIFFIDTSNSNKKEKVVRSDVFQIGVNDDPKELKLEDLYKKDKVKYTKEEFIKEHTENYITRIKAKREEALKNFLKTTKDFSAKFSDHPESGGRQIAFFNSGINFQRGMNDIESSFKDPKFVKEWFVYEYEKLEYKEKIKKSNECIKKLMKGEESPLTSPLPAIIPSEQASPNTQSSLGFFRTAFQLLGLIKKPEQPQVTLPVDAKKFGGPGGLPYNKNTTAEVQQIVNEGLGLVKEQRRKEVQERRGRSEREEQSRIEKQQNQLRELNQIAEQQRQKQLAEISKKEQDKKIAQEKEYLRPFIILKQDLNENYSRIKNIKDDCGFYDKLYELEQNFLIKKPSHKLSEREKDEAFKKIDTTDERKAIFKEWLKEKFGDKDAFEYEKCKPELEVKLNKRMADQEKARTLASEAKSRQKEDELRESKLEDLERQKKGLSERLNTLRIKEEDINSLAYIRTQSEIRKLNVEIENFKKATEEIIIKRQETVLKNPTHSSPSNSSPPSVSVRGSFKKDPPLKAPSTNTQSAQQNFGNWLGQASRSVSEASVQASQGVSEASSQAVNTLQNLFSWGEKKSPNSEPPTKPSDSNSSLQASLTRASSVPQNLGSSSEASLKRASSVPQKSETSALNRVTKKIGSFKRSSGTFDVFYDGESYKYGNDKKSLQIFDFDQQTQANQILKDRTGSGPFLIKTGNKIAILTNKSYGDNPTFIMTMLDPESKKQKVQGNKENENLENCMRSLKRASSRLTKVEPGGWVERVGGRDGKPKPFHTRGG